MNPSPLAAPPLSHSPQLAQRLLRFVAGMLLPAALLPALALAVVVSACSTGPLVSNARVEPGTISPNADGANDATRISYTIHRPSDVSIYLVDAKGQRHYFRQDRRRAARDYNVLWGGVIDGRVLPNGAYTWTVEATDDAGRTDQATGELNIVDADNNPPQFENFAVNPTVITPNQDGIDDRASITYYLSKKVDGLQVYLLATKLDDGSNPNPKYPLAETEREIKPTEPGFHFYDYDGGIDLGADPPPDGDYFVVADAQDLAGNRTVVTETLTIDNGGKPRADIVKGEITMIHPDSGDLNIPLGGAMIFTATIENYGSVPIRTAGPWPGTVYHSNENFNTLAYREQEKSWFEQSGTWRFGLNFQANPGQDFPFRYAVGRREDLRCEMVDGREQCFLDPGKRGLVYGTVIWDTIPGRNPFQMWGGLLHEDVEVVNNFADVQEVKIADPNQGK
jgi:hypothetical protein